MDNLLGLKNDGDPSIIESGIHNEDDLAMISALQHLLLS